MRVVDLPKSVSSQVYLGQGSVSMVFVRLNLDVTVETGAIIKKVKAAQNNQCVFILDFGITI